MASSGRRSSSPHLPPEQYCTISSASPPTAQSEGEHQSQHPGAQHVIQTEAILRTGQKSRITAITEKTAPTISSARFPAVHKGRCAQIGGSVLACEVAREPFRSSLLLRPRGPVCLAGIVIFGIGRIGRSHRRSSLAWRSVGYACTAVAGIAHGCAIIRMAFLRVARSFRFLHLRARRHILRRRRLAQLQCANVRRHRPAIRRRQLRRVVRHRAVAVRHHVKVVRDRLRTCAPGRADWPPACSRAAQSRPARCPPASGTACSRC